MSMAQLGPATAATAAATTTTILAWQAGSFVFAARFDSFSFSPLEYAVALEWPTFALAIVG